MIARAKKRNAVLSRAVVEQIEQRIREGETDTVIGRRFGIHASTVAKIRRGDQFHQQSNAERARRLALAAALDPTAEEIAAKCATIQAAWSDDERDQRWRASRALNFSI